MANTACPDQEGPGSAVLVEHGQGGAHGEAQEGRSGRVVIFRCDWQASLYDIDLV